MNNKSKYSFIAKKQFLLNGADIDLNHYEAIVENDMIYFSKDESCKITLRNGLPYIISINFVGSIAEVGDNLDNNMSLLLMYLNEITTNDINKGIFEEISNLKSCGFWDTYYIYSTGVSRSVSETNIDREVKQYQGGCSLIGDKDTSCAFSSHFCVTTQAVCCDN